MRNTKSARNRAKARGTASRSGRLNPSRLKFRSTRLRVEELEQRVVPSSTPS